MVICTPNRHLAAHTPFPYRQLAVKTSFTCFKEYEDKDIFLNPELARHFLVFSCRYSQFGGFIEEILSASVGMPDSEELDVQIAAEALSNLWQGGSSPRNARTMAVAATATSIGRSSSQLLRQVRQHPLMSIPVRMYRNSRSYSRNSAIKLRTMIARRRLESAKANDPNIRQQKSNGMRRRWKRLMLSAGLASLSRESRERVRYCVHLLKLATKNLGLKVNQLKLIVQEERALLKAAAAHKKYQKLSRGSKRNNVKTAIASLKRDIVLTVYKSVAVVSNVAGSTLPEPARTHVRNYIMRLPSKWAQNIQAKEDADARNADARNADVRNADARNATVWSTPEPDYEHLNAVTTRSFEGDINEDIIRTRNASISSQDYSDNNEQDLEEINCRRIDLEMGDRVVSLAQESLDMLEQIAKVFGETLEKAESWVERWKFGKKGNNKDTNGTERHSSQDSDSEYDTADEYDGSFSDDGEDDIGEEAVEDGEDTGLYYDDLFMEEDESDLFDNITSSENANANAAEELRA